MSLSEKTLQKSHQLLRHLGLLPMASADSVRHAAIYTHDRALTFLCDDVLDTRAVVPGCIPGSFITTAAIKDNAVICIKSAFPNKRVNLWRPFKTMSINAVYLSVGSSIFRYPLSKLEQQTVEFINDRAFLSIDASLTHWNQIECVNAKWRMPSRAEAIVKIQIQGEVNRLMETLRYSARFSKYTGLLLKPDFEYSEKPPCRPEHVTPEQINTIFNNDTNVIGYTLIAE